MRPRGAYPTSRARLAAAKPHRVVGVAPAQFIRLPSVLSAWGNFYFGDCVTAEEAFAKACYNPEIFIPQHKIVVWARKNYVLNGAGLIEVIDLMQTEGIDHDGKTYYDGPPFAVDWTNPAILQNAIWQGVVKLGVSGDPLENVVPNPPSNGWVATGLSGGPQDHCVALSGYGTFGYLANELGVALPANIPLSTPGYAMFTWDSVGMIDYPSLLAITGEAWIRNPTTIIKADS